jgi:nucleoside-diphosphate-sugar epimerase
VNLFVFGLGYTSLHFVRSQAPRFARVSGTVRSAGKAETLRGEGIEALAFGPDARDPAIPARLAEADALLVSVPPDPEAGDPVIEAYGDMIASSPRLAWIGYLSTIGVYGDQGGAWIDETAPLHASSARTRARVAVERAWLDLGERAGKPVQVFRLAGIYGPGRNALVNLRAGTAKRILKPGQVFNRIHADDIAAVLAASLDRPRAGAVYNVADDEPAPPQDVVAYAAELMGVEPPPETPFAAASLSPMGRSFYGENKRVSNRLIREELGVDLAYPSYREALRALREAGEGGDDGSG